MVVFDEAHNCSTATTTEVEESDEDKVIKGPFRECYEKIAKSSFSKVKLLLCSGTFTLDIKRDLITRLFSHLPEMQLAFNHQKSSPERSRESIFYHIELLKINSVTTFTHLLWLISLINEFGEEKIKLLPQVILYFKTKRQLKFCCDWILQNSPIWMINYVEQHHSDFLTFKEREVIIKDFCQSNSKSIIFIFNKIIRVLIAK